MSPTRTGQRPAGKLTVSMSRARLLPTAADSAQVTTQAFGERSGEHLYR